MTIRMFATLNTTGTIGGSAGTPAQRAYPATVGQPIDVPGDLTGDAAALANQGFVALGTSGPTPARPTSNVRPGAIHVDTGINAVVFWDGATWRSPLTGTQQ
jgi:hypothetical protein